MKIAIASGGKELSGNVSEIFGRCPYFIIAEIENGKIVKTEALKNESEKQSSGAGMAAARFLAENGADAVAVKTVGPRAADVLRQFDIKVYNEGGKIEDVLRKFADKN